MTQLGQGQRGGAEFRFPPICVRSEGLLGVGARPKYMLSAVSRLCPIPSGVSPLHRGLDVALRIKPPSISRFAAINAISNSRSGRPRRRAHASGRSRAQGSRAFSRSRVRERVASCTRSPSCRAGTRPSSDHEHARAALHHGDGTCCDSVAHKESWACVCHRTDAHHKIRDESACIR